MKKRALDEQKQEAMRQRALGAFERSMEVLTQEVASHESDMMSCSETVRHLAKNSSETENKDLADVWEHQAKRLLTEIEMHKAAIKRLNGVMAVCRQRLQQRQQFCLENRVMQLTAEGAVDQTEVDHAVDRTEVIAAEESDLKEMTGEFRRATAKAVASEATEPPEKVVEETSAHINEQWLAMKMASMPVKDTPSVAAATVTTARPKSSSSTPKRQAVHAYRHVVQ